MTKIKKLKESVKIVGGFPGTYTWKGGRSYYPDGTENIHFTLDYKSDDDGFYKFHVTKSIGGSNVHIYYIKGVSNGVGKLFLPHDKLKIWQEWWTSENKGLCDQAALEFWQNVQ